MTRRRQLDDDEPALPNRRRLLWSAHRNRSLVHSYRGEWLRKLLPTNRWFPVLQGKYLNYTDRCQCPTHRASRGHRAIYYDWTNYTDARTQLAGT